MEQTKQAAEAERLVQTYADMILRLCYTYLNNTQDAEDICQETFLKLLTAPRTFASREHEKAWVLRTAANACKDLLKSPRRSRTCSLEVCADLPTPAAGHALPHRALSALLRGLQPERDRPNSGHPRRHRRHAAAARA